jgi:hypothetical protein
MNLFRSEEHIARWLGDRPPGATVTIDDLAALGSAWYVDRLDPGWRPHTRDDNQTILDRLGLSEAFWRLG